MMPFMSPLLRQAAGVVTGPDPLPALPSSANIRYWFTADRDVYSDAAGTVPCVDGDPIYLWGNQGTQEDAQQPSAARRPIFKTGGKGGKPYIQATAANAQYFENLLASSPYNSIATSQSNWNGWNTIALVIQNDNPADGKLRAIIEKNSGSAVSRIGVYWRPASNSLRVFKNGWAFAQFSDGGTHIAVFSHQYTAQAARYSNDTVDSGSVTDSSNPASTVVNAGELGFLRSAALGANNAPVDGGYWNGRIQEMIMWQNIGFMSTTDMLTVASYLRSKYGF